MKRQQLFIYHDSIVFLTENKTNVYFLHSLSHLQHEIDKMQRRLVQLMTLQRGLLVI